MRTTLLLLLLALSTVAQDRGALFDNAVRRIEREFYDPGYVRDTLPGLAARFRAEARAADSYDAELAVIQTMLAEIPASHVALCESYTHDATYALLDGRQAPTLGVVLTVVDSGFYVRSVLPGGPAARAGLLRGDRVLAIDGVRTEQSPRIEWRSDDPWLPDTPAHLLACEEGERVRFRIARRPGEERELVVEAGLYSLGEATDASATVFERGGHRLGYLHLDYIYQGADYRLARRLRRELEGCAGLVLDLRGRGGVERTSNRIISYLSGPRALWHGPIVLLIDVNTRSAKELIAHRLQASGRARTVGQNTTGAVLYSRSFSIGEGAYIMLPVGEVPYYSDVLEAVGVAPDVPVEVELAYAAGADPILDAGLRELEAALGSWVD